MAVKQDNLRRLMQTESDVRLFSGYSGWAPGQLENEIERGGWYSTEASSSLIFGDPMDRWRQACEQFGNGIISDVVGKQVSNNPSLN